MPATYDSIATTTLGAAATITFSSIPATYTDLRVVLVAQDPTGLNTVYVQFNSDTSGSGTNYSNTRLLGEGTSAQSNRNTNDSGIYIGPLINTQWSLHEIDIFNYAGSTNKTTLHKTSADRNGAGQIMVGVGLWRSTAAITSVVLSSGLANFKAGTTATLYGIKAA